MKLLSKALSMPEMELERDLNPIISIMGNGQKTECG